MVLNRRFPAPPYFGEFIFMSNFRRFLLLATVPIFVPAMLAQAVSPTINSNPSREFGQPGLLPGGLNSVAPNYVEGRELYSPAAIAFDTTSSPPILYIADTANNRVLAYQNPAALSNCGLNNPGCGFATKVIGQNSLTATLPGGPGRPGPSVGFYQPTGLAVDSGGNLYVADEQNNRILRFPAPLKQTAALVTPDLIIGQADLYHNQQNQGQGQPSAQSLSFSTNGIRTVGMAFDSSGNLWVTDGGNNRALRFPAASLKAGAQPAADLVIGQTTFTSNSLAPPPSGVPAQFVMTTLNQPTALAFDSNGNLYIADSYGRVLYYQAPLASGMSAARILGAAISYQNNPLPNTNQYGLSGVFGLATVNNHLFAADIGNNRIVEYDLPGNWPPAANYQTLQPGQQISPPMMAVVGQGNFTTGSANHGLPQASSGSLSAPAGIAFLGNDLWVADLSNNRVLDFPPQSGGGYINASRVVGQLDFPYSAPNLIEGREVNFFGANPAGAIAIDHHSTPPHLYIADTYNNRILCFKDARSVQASSHADMVLGQSTPGDFYDNEINSGTNNPATPTQTGLYLPVGIVVDANGDVFVADSGNGRVLRFPAPFAQPSNSQQLPNLVLGQAGFSGPTITDPTQQNMHTPWGLALLSNGSLAVSDAFDNRILVFTRPAGGDFQNGQAASIVLGQPNFTSIAKSNSTAGLYSPTAISVDSSDRLYVCDTGNNRVVVFNGVPTAASGATSSFQLNNLSSPQGIVVTQDTGEIWIANTGSNVIYRFPLYEQVILLATPNNYQSVITAQLPTQTGPLGLALDNSDNLLVAETANRITFFFAQLAFASEASYNNLQMAPGELVGVSRVGKDFSFTQDYNLSGISPWPTSESANDIEVLVNGTPAPIFRVDPTFISFQVPTSTPPSGTAVVQVVHPSTGEIMGEGDFTMSPYQPAFFTRDATGIGQVAAFQSGPDIDNCTDKPACQINSSSYPIPANGRNTISFCLTGGGVFQGGPPDGVAPTQAAPTAVPPQLISRDGYGSTQGLVPPSAITYSGAGCGFAGGWQVNFLVPNTFAPGQHVIAITLGGVGSTIGYNGQPLQVYFTSK